MDDLVERIDDIAPLVGAMVLGFANDPFVRWMLPAPQTYLTAFDQLVRIHGQRTADAGGAFAITSRRAAALWYPPDVHPDRDAIGAVLAAAGVPDGFSEVWAAVAEHEPSVPHWYLRQIAVDPPLHGRGLGQRLLQESLRVVDAAQGVAYLEASSEGSKRLYERFGFISRGTVQRADAPPLWPMVREPVIAN